MAASNNPAPDPPPRGLFDDLFHPRGDDNDIQEDELVDFDDVAIDVDKKAEIQAIQPDDDPVAIEEQRLSQRLSQLSASHEEAEPTAPVAKKLKLDEDMPLYLSAKHKLFDQTLGPILRQTATSLTIEELRQIARLVHNLAVSQLWISLWQTYLLSGTGQLNKDDPSPAQDRPMIWPAEVKTTMIQRHVTTARNESDIDHAACLNFVQSYLHRLRTDVARVQGQLSHY
jgi:hypothetical protein